MFCCYASGALRPNAVDTAVRHLPEAQVRHWEPVGKVVGNTYWTIPVVKSKE